MIVNLFPVAIGIMILVDQMSQNYTLVTLVAHFCSSKSSFFVEQCSIKMVEDEFGG